MKDICGFNKVQRLLVFSWWKKMDGKFWCCKGSARREVTSFSSGLTDDTFEMRPVEINRYLHPLIVSPYVELALRRRNSSPNGDQRVQLISISTSGCEHADYLFIWAPRLYGCNEMPHRPEELAAVQIWICLLLIKLIRIAGSESACFIWLGCFIIKLNRVAKSEFACLMYYFNLRSPNSQCLRVTFCAVLKFESFQPPCFLLKSTRLFKIWMFLH